MAGPGAGPAADPSGEHRARDPRDSLGERPGPPRVYSAPGSFLRFA